MEKKLVREVEFGKATARLTVTTKLEDKIADGQKYGEGIVCESKVEIVAPNGEVVTDEINASYIGERTFVGKAATDGNEVAKNIQSTIEEMKSEILKEENKEETTEEEIAQNIIEKATNQGIDKLMTSEKIREWRKNYNDLVNEGGEGYIPNKISKEQYEWANNLLNGLNIKENIHHLFESGITNYKISKETGIAQTTLGRFTRKESDIGNMSLDNAIKLNKYFLKNIKKTLD